MLHEFLQFDLQDNIGFDVFLHFGTLLALIVFFYKDIIKYLKAFFQSFVDWKLDKDLDQKLVWQIIYATIPALVVAYFFEDAISIIFRNSFSVAIMLILIGLLFFIIEKFSAKIKDINQLSWSGAIIIGLFQIFALIPGVSRSGITIIAGLSNGLKRDQAAKFSFLIAIPIVFLATIKKGIDFISAGINSNEILLYLIGLIFSFVFGYLAIKYFLKFTQNYSLNIFGVYRIILGLVILFLFLI